MRYKLLSVVLFVAGYIAGIIFGYRAAAVDYVENDARTIRAMADSMYESMDDIPEEVVQQMEAKETEPTDGSESESGASAFQ